MALLHLVKGPSCLALFSSDVTSSVMNEADSGGASVPDAKLPERYGGNGMQWMAGVTLQVFHGFIMDCSMR